MTISPKSFNLLFVNQDLMKHSKIVFRATFIVSLQLRSTGSEKKIAIIFGNEEALLEPLKATDKSK